MSTFPGETSGKVIGNFVDVRDAALAHILALSTPAAGGERIISAGGEGFHTLTPTVKMGTDTADETETFAWQDLYDILIDEGFASVPGRETYGKSKAAATPPVYSNAKSLKLFPGVQYRGLRESVQEMGKELVAAGLL